MARAAQDDRTHGGKPVQDPTKTLAILLAWRRGLPGPGHRRRIPQPLRAGRLLGRWRHPYHRQQPDRLHHRLEGFSLHALCRRPRQGVRNPGPPRQRRRSRGVYHRRPVRHGLPARVPEGLPDRPRRIPPLGPQRGRRAGIHPAPDVPGDLEAPHCARPAGLLAGEAGRRLGEPRHGDGATRARSPDAHPAQHHRGDRDLRRRAATGQVTPRGSGHCRFAGAAPCTPGRRSTPFRTASRQIRS